MSIPLYGMVGYIYRDKRSLEASIKYLVLSAAASTFLLFGMALVYAQTGSLAFASLAGAVQTGAPLFTTGLAMILIGIAFKLSLAPFHLWTPDVYHGAPAPVGAFLATVSKIAVLLVLLRWWNALGLGQTALFTTLLAALAGAVDPRRQPAGPAANQREAAARLLLDRAFRLSAGRRSSPATSSAHEP